MNYRNPLVMTALANALAQAGIGSPTGTDPDPTPATPPQGETGTPTPTPTPTPRAKLDVPPLSADSLNGWYADHAEKTGAASGEARRIKVLVQMVAQAEDAKALREVLKPFVEQAPKGTSERKVLLTRSAEVKALYGVHKLAPDQMPTGKGYHATVADCRKVLETLRMKFDGSALKDEATRKAEKTAGREADIERKARIEYHKAINTGKTKEEAEAAEEAARQGYTGEMLNADAERMATALWKRYAKEGADANGVAMIRQLASILNATLHVYDEKVAAKGSK